MEAALSTLVAGWNDLQSPLKSSQACAQDTTRSVKAFIVDLSSLDPRLVGGVLVQLLIDDLIRTHAFDRWDVFELGASRTRAGR